MSDAPWIFLPCYRLGEVFPDVADTFFVPQTWRSLDFRECYKPGEVVPAAAGAFAFASKESSTWKTNEG